jgi:acetoin utilization deacetylase AcuC-like enzyme
MPPGRGTEAYDDVNDRVVILALEKFRPSVIIVPNGFRRRSRVSPARGELNSDHTA